ncbi:MAG: N-acetyltransferase, partial [Thermostichus sp. BF3_bins_97]
KSLFMPTRAVHIRPEGSKDLEAIYAIHGAAFATSAEADLVNALRDQTQPLLSLVAEDSDSQALVGHILFSPVKLTGHGQLTLTGLAPLAVLPTHQNQGIGSTLVRSGLGQGRQRGWDGVVVLGHPHFYHRFGFRTAAEWEIRCEYEVPEEAFMVLELRPGSLQGRSGTIQYADPFKALG